MQPQTTYDWLSAHLFYKGSAEHLLSRIVQPFVAQTGALLHSTSPYFFIRYAEEGLHIRLRLHAGRHQLAPLMQMLEADVAGSNYTLKYIPYTPEIKRYGNATTMALAEALFHASSACCLQFITDKPGWNIQTALPVACQMHITFLHALNEEPEILRTICRQFIDAWMTMLLKDAAHSFTEQLMSHMHEKYNRQASIIQPMAISLWHLLQRQQAPPPLQEYSNACRWLLAQYKRAGLPPEHFGYAMRSLLHMTNNRLGIPNKEEAWCLFITDQCIQHIYEQAG